MSSSGSRHSDLDREPFIYEEELVYDAVESDEPVTKISRTSDHRTLYHAFHEVDGTCWRATIDTLDEREEYDSTPRVKFSRCSPDADLAMLREWTDLATGRLSGPQTLPEWESLFTVFNVALGLYHQDDEHTEKEGK